MKKHTTVTFFDLLCLPLALKDGQYVADRPKSVAIAYLHPDTNKEYLAAVKVTLDECELWLTTFHRTTPQKIEGVFRRGKWL